MYYFVLHKMCNVMWIIADLYLTLFLCLVSNLLFHSHCICPERITDVLLTFILVKLHCEKFSNLSPLCCSLSFGFRLWVVFEVRLGWNHDWLVNQSELWWLSLWWEILINVTMVILCPVNAFLHGALVHDWKGSNFFCVLHIAGHFFPFWF